MDKEQQLRKKLLVTFKIEAEEHLRAISFGLLELEKVTSPERQMEIIETVFRESHSLKGAARAVNLPNVEAVCQSLEGRFAALKAKKIALTPDILNKLHDEAGTLSKHLTAANAESSQAEQILPLQIPKGLTPPTTSGAELIGHTTQAAKTEGSSQRSIQRSIREEARPEQSEVIRVPVSKLDSLFRRAEELIPTKATAAHRPVELREIGEMLSHWEKECKKVRPQAHSLRRSIEQKSNSNGEARSANDGGMIRLHSDKVLDFLEQNDAFLQSVKNKLSLTVKHLENDRRMLERRVDDLVEDVTLVSMVPFSSLLGVFPNLVRELCRDCGKDADLEISGGDIEADRRILEEMKDPLIHLVRNCIDHGVESPKQRKEMHKPSRAKIRIAISPKSADKVEISVSDDGAGIDVEKVRAAAIKHHVVSKDEAEKMDEQESLSLIFESGVSTSSMITEVSGRGLGLAIVREKAEKVGGSVSIDTQPGTGTTFRLSLPLTLARFRGVIVEVGGEHFVLPVMHIQRVLRVNRDAIQSLENRETIQMNGQAISLVRLGDVLRVPRKITPDEKHKESVVIVTWADEQIAFLVDEIVREQEVLVKALGKQLPHVRNISGAMVLGTGKVLPVLNAADLMRSAIMLSPVTVTAEAEETAKSILVAEDSITTRTLLKNILEFAGYRVKTAVDGAEALATLGTEEFDLLVSDVDMPRMSGFDLTAKIRADKRLSELPVVLVTSLESREDRERGIDVGANAYIVKNSFDQGNLLEVIHRLI